MRAAETVAEDGSAVGSLDPTAGTISTGERLLVARLRISSGTSTSFFTSSRPSHFRCHLSRRKHARDGNLQHGIARGLLSQSAHSHRSALKGLGTLPATAEIGDARLLSAAVAPPRPTISSRSRTVAHAINPPSGFVNRLSSDLRWSRTSRTDILLCGRLLRFTADRKSQDCAVNHLSAKLTINPVEAACSCKNVRDIRVNIDRPGFTLNPTSCNTMSISGTLTSNFAQSSTVSSPFQASSCQSLKFAPKFSVSTNGKTSKANGASLNVKLTYPPNAIGFYANLAKAKVSLPKQLPSRLTTLQKACTSQVFDQNWPRTPTCAPQSSRCRANSPRRTGLG